MTIQYEPVFWPGSGSDPSGLTPQGIFDDDEEFSEEAPRFAEWAALRLGYPVMQVELTDKMFYACFEEAVIEYSAQINEFNMRDNMITLQGITTGSSVSQTLVVGNPLAMAVELSTQYGTEAGSGGNVDYKRAVIPVTASVNAYDLKDYIEARLESGNKIEIRRVFHSPPPAISRIFDPFAAGGMGVSNMLGAFGWGGYAVETQYLLTPVYETLLRTQAIEFTDTVRRSQYSFEIANNKIRIYPIPDGTTFSSFTIEYNVKRDKSAAAISTVKGIASDYSNVPYTTIMYSNINDVGKRWIWRYALALSKETLGAVRIKYATIPIPNSEVTLDGAELKQEAAQEKDKLWEQLRETLALTGRAKQLEMSKENEANSMELLKHVPTLIYIG